MIRIEESVRRKSVIYRLVAVVGKSVTYQKVVYRVCDQSGVNEIEHANE